MKKQIWVAALLIALLLALGACTAAPAPTPTPMPANTAAATVAPSVAPLPAATEAQGAVEPGATTIPGETTAPSGEMYQPGTYTGSAKGYGGPVEVTVTVDKDKITDCKATGENETEGVGSKAVEELPAKIVEANGKVDAVSGATVTSNAIFTALEQALSQARG